MGKQNETEGKLSELPACAAEFIKLVINKMRYRREVRQDVQAELAVHFEDELKDLATDEEKAQKAQQLIAGFGDVKLLAVLLRRAKKRCRPLWRTAVVRTFQTIGVLIVCFVIYVVWFLTGKPVITTNYVAELNRIVRPVADDSQNAAPLYEKAAELYEKVPQDISKLLGKKYREAAAEEKQLIEKWIRENSETLDLIIAGTQKPYYWQNYGGGGDWTDMMGIRMPNLNRFKELARALLWRSRLRAEQGRYEDAFGDIKSCYRFGQHIRGDKTLIEQLVGIAIEALSVRTIREIIGEYEIDSTILADFQRYFEQIIADENFAISFEAEKLCMYDEIQRCFTSDRIGKGHLYLPRFRRISNMAGSYEGEGIEPFILDLVCSVPYLFGHPNKEETLKSVNELYDYYEQLSLKTAVERHAESDAIDDKFKELVNGNVFLRTLTPAIGRVIEIGDRVPTDVRAALTMIAIFRYNRDAGRFPQNLNQLVTAGYLRQLPIDSFSDKPLVYKKTEDNFILYSFGHNCIDDGGEPGRNDKGRLRKWGDNGDQVFWPVPESQLKQ